MAPVVVAPITEGYGDEAAVPILLRRLLQRTLGNDAMWRYRPVAPFRVPRYSLVRPGVLERYVEFAAERAVEAARGRNFCGGVLVLVDAEDDCPATLGPDLLRRARAARHDVASTVVLANREYEAWFLAAAASLGGYCGLPATLARRRTRMRFAGRSNGYARGCRAAAATAKPSTNRS